MKLRIMPAICAACAYCYDPREPDEQGSPNSECCCIEDGVRLRTGVIDPAARACSQFRIKPVFAGIAFTLDEHAEDRHEAYLAAALASTPPGSPRPAVPPGYPPFHATCGACAHCVIKRYGSEFATCDIHKIDGEFSYLWRCCASFEPTDEDKGKPFILPSYVHKGKTRNE